MIVPVVLCGGSGTRLWPLSRRDHPKQHIPVLNGESPFQRTLRRVGFDARLDRPIVIVGADSRFMAVEQATQTGVTPELVLEPEGRDTLPAIALAAEVAARRDPEAVLLVLPSDHLIPQVKRFLEAVERAAEAARAGGLAVFGIAPNAPSTAFGYIRPGEPIGSGRRVAAFVEKPDAERAQALIADGCRWNAGMFCFRVDTLREEIRRHAPETAEAVARGLETATMDLGALRIGDAFLDAPKTSFDYGVMEKTDAAVMIDADFAWSDIGDWREMWRQSDKNSDGVALEGPAVALDTRDSLIHAEGRLVCALGVDDMAIIDTPDALLVAPLARSQEVKALVRTLEDQGRTETLSSARVHRPWGWYQTTDLGARFRVKRILVSPGKKLSLQKHHHRAEHWVVVRGTAEVQRDNETILLRENESIYLPLGCVHRLANPGKIPVEIIEVQTGAYLEEDDIVRIEDDFGRE